MSLRSKIEEDLKAALRSGDRTRLSVLRMLKSKIVEAEVEKRASRGRDYTLDDQEVISVIQSYAKQRRQSIEGYRQGGREDLARQEEAELQILQEYLPEPLSEQELHDLARQVIEEVGASGPRDMGSVMKVMMERVRGRADGKTVSTVVRQLLSSPEG